MNIQMDLNNLTNEQPVIDAFISTEHQYPEPTAAADGVSFPALPTLKRFVITTTVIALGTTSLTNTQRVDLDQFQGLGLVFPSGPEAKPLAAAERFAQLRREIVAAGIPLLNDDELREEIRERKGIKSEPEA